MEYFLYSISEAHQVISQLQDMECSINELNNTYQYERETLEELEINIERS